MYFQYIFGSKDINTFRFILFAEVTPNIYESDTMERKGIPILVYINANDMAWLESLKDSLGVPKAGIIRIAIKELREGGMFAEKAKVRK